MFKKLIGPITALVVAAGAGVYGGSQIPQSQPAPLPVPEPEVRLVTGIRSDGTEFDGLVVNGVLQQGILPAAPFMTPAWENADIRERRVTTWCLAELPDEATRVMARKALTEVFALFKDLPRWQEGCNGTTYQVTATAQVDCGIGDAALGCAVYGGLRGIRISINGNWYSRGQMSPEGAYWVLLHEIGHFFGLGHTTCEWLVYTVLTGIFMPHGPACGAVNKPGSLISDYDEAIRHYGLVPVGQDPPVPPIPPVKVRIVAQRWIELVREPGCPQDQRSGDWCILTVELPAPHVDGSFYPIVVDRNGELTYPYGWAEVKP